MAQVEGIALFSCYSLQFRIDFVSWRDVKLLVFLSSYEVFLNDETLHFLFVIKNQLFLLLFFYSIFV